MKTTVLALALIVGGHAHAKHRGYYRGASVVELQKLLVVPICKDGIAMPDIFVDGKAGPATVATARVQIKACRGELHRE